MKKLIFSLVCLLISVHFVMADGDQPTSQTSAERVSIKILPRFFNNKLIIDSNSQFDNQTCVLHVFSADGSNVLNQTIDLSKGQFIYYTNLYKNGEFIYYIMVNDKIIVRGSFIKS